jgi:hypothetical protein
MKNKEQMQEMYDLIGGLNDGHFMNQDYRRGVLDGLSFYLHPHSQIEEIKRHLQKVLNCGD